MSIETLLTGAYDEYMAKGEASADPETTLETVVAYRNAEAIAEFAQRLEYVEPHWSGREGKARNRAKAAAEQFYSGV